MTGAGQPTNGSSQLIAQTDYTLGSLGSGDSDTRTTTATYINSSGVLSTAAINTARFDYTGGSANGWLVEVASTNYVLYSNTFSNADWTTENGSVTKNVTGPDGVTNSAWTYLEDGTNTTHRIYENTAIVGGTTYTESLFVKYISRQWINIRLDSSVIVKFAWFDLLNSVVGGASAGVTSTMAFIGNGFYRAAIITPNASNGNNSCFQDTSANNSSAAFAGSSSIIVYGSQIENLGYATSYIPTTTAAATRAADVAANSGWSTNYLMVESTSESTLITSRASYCASGCTGTSFSAPSAVWIKRICQYNATPAGATAAQTAAGQANGTACS
jgi:hypothetical protein